MRQVTIDYPIDILPPGMIPKELLALTPSIRFLRLDSNGFLFTFRVALEKYKSAMKSLRRHYTEVQRGPIRIAHEGQGVLVVGGSWVQDGQYLWNDYKGYLSRKHDFSNWMELYQNKTFLLRPPETCGNSIRFIFACDSEVLKGVVKMLKSLNLPYKVEKVSSFKKSGDSAFDRLTLQQAKVLQLAYVEGYYDVPRKISTEQLADLLKMEKGNVGEHLRRAEKNVMDFLMTN